MVQQCRDKGQQSYVICVLLLLSWKPAAVVESCAFLEQRYDKMRLNLCHRVSGQPLLRSRKVESGGGCSSVILRKFRRVGVLGYVAVASCGI
jgi:hypothetical protein